MRVLLLILAFALAAPAAGQTTYTWVGGSGSWFAAGSWSPSGIPGTGDTALITNGSPNLMRDTTVAVVEFGGASLDGDGHLTVTGSMEWSAGQMNGRGFAETAALTIPSGATLRITGDEEKSIRGRDIFNEGTIVWEGTGDLVVMWGTTIENRAGATFDIQNDAQITRTNGTLQFLNDGLLVKSAGAGNSRFAFPFGRFENEGTLRVGTGTLLFDNGTSSSLTSGGDGAFEVEAGARLWFNRAFAFEAGSTLSGAGTARFSQGTTTMGRATMTGTTQLSGGVLRLTNTDTPSELADVSVSGGGLGGPADTNVNGMLTWTGGALGTEFSSVGTLTLLGGAEVSGPAAKQFDGGTLVNNGTFRWLEGPLQVTSSSSLRNLPGATISIESDESWTRSNGFIDIVNQGTIVKTGTTGTTSISLPFKPINNDGEVLVESGTLSIAAISSSSASTDTGRYLIAEGATLRLGGTTRTFTADASIEGTGTLGIDGPVLFGGTIRPGASPGVLAVSGGLPAMQAGGVLEMEIGGLSPGSQHDQLAVTGAAALGGTLRIDLVDGFTPALDDRFLLIAAVGGATGSFDTIELPSGLMAYVARSAVGAELVIGTPVAGETDGPEAPLTFALAAPAPNPSASAVTPAYTLPDAGAVRLAVFDALGREVAVLADGEVSAGAYTARLDASRLAPGVYVARLVAGAETMTRRLTVVR